MTGRLGRIPFTVTSFDTLIVGQGVAGTAVAWHLRWAGRRVCVLDRGGPSASRVAAGLVTPVTGQRLAVSWRLAELLPAAVAFYRRVEAETGASLFHQHGAIRLFADAVERTAFDGRADTLLRSWVGPAEPPPNPEAFTTPHGAFGMPDASRLDVGHYLDASREVFARDGGFREADVNPARDLEATPDGIRVPHFDLTAGSAVFCQGFAAAGNPWFPALRLNPAKGEILTLRIPDLIERRTVHRGVWLAPVGGDLFRAGATYDHDSIDATLTERGRQQIEAGLRSFLRLPFEVVDHRAGVRPVVPGNRPAFELSPRDPRVAFLNGFGSKGVLQAPFFAAELIERLTGAARCES